MIYDYSNPPESASALWYDPKINRFRDEEGAIHHDLHEFFDLWQLDEWKKTREYGVLTDKNGDLWELYYPNSLGKELCDHDCVLCGSKCEIYAYLNEWQQEQSYIRMREEIFE